MYLKFALCRRDDAARAAQENSVVAAGGDLKGFAANRKSLRQLLKENKDKGKEAKSRPEEDSSGELTSEQFRKWASRMKDGPVYENVAGQDGEGKLISRG